MLVGQLTSPQQHRCMRALLKVLHGGRLCQDLAVRPPAHHLEMLSTLAFCTRPNQEGFCNAVADGTCTIVQPKSRC